MTEAKPAPLGHALNVRNYIARQRKNGNVQVKVWVPASMVDWMHCIAEEARMLARIGADPLANAPHTLIASGEAVVK